MKENELQEHEQYANIAVPYNVRNKLKAFAATSGLSIKDMATKAIEQYLKQEKDKNNEHI